MPDLSEKLEEAVWPPGSRPSLDQAIRRSPYEPSRRRERLWAAFLPDDPPEIILCARHLEKDAGFPELAGYLREVAPTTLLGYLYAVDTYRQSRISGTPLPETAEVECRSDDFVDRVLYPSMGILLWQFQLEQLAQGLGLSRRDAVDLRRDLNQKRPSALDAVEGKTFPSGQPLSKIIDDRLLYNSVLPGRWHAARLLLQA